MNRDKQTPAAFTISSLLAIILFTWELTNIETLGQQQNATNDTVAILNQTDPATGNQPSMMIDLTQPDLGQLEDGQEN